MDRLCYGDAKTQWPNLEHVKDLSRNSSRSKNSRADSEEPGHGSRASNTFREHYRCCEHEIDGTAGNSYDDQLPSREKEQVDSRTIQRYPIDPDRTTASQITMESTAVDSEIVSNFSEDSAETELYEGAFTSRRQEARDILLSGSSHSQMLLFRYAQIIAPGFLQELLDESCAVDTSFHEQENFSEQLATSLPELTGDYTDILQAIDCASRRRFQAISFKDGLRYLCSNGETRTSVDDFYIWHCLLEEKIRHIIKTNATEHERYTLVEQVSGQ